jgi:hypothetical protein
MKHKKKLLCEKMFCGHKRQLEALVEIRKEEHALAEEILQKQARQAVKLAKKSRTVEETVEELIP